MVDAFLGKWKLSESHNFDNYLGAMGVKMCFVQNTFVLS